MCRSVYEIAIYLRYIASCSRACVLQLDLASHGYIVVPDGDSSLLYYDVRSPARRAAYEQRSNSRKKSYQRYFNYLEFVICLSWFTCHRDFRSGTKSALSGPFNLLGHSVPTWARSGDGSRALLKAPP